MSVKVTLPLCPGTKTVDEKLKENRSSRKSKLSRPVYLVTDSPFDILKVKFSQPRVNSASVTVMVIVKSIS